MSRMRKYLNGLMFAVTLINALFLYYRFSKDQRTRTEPVRRVRTADYASRSSSSKVKIKIRGELDKALQPT